MNKVVINSYNDFEKYLGKELGYSDYMKITQDKIDKFADATEDHQWIHCDVERAKEESPYHNTIAHGYLTMSLLPYLWNQIVDVKNIELLINYGIENLKFQEPVIVDSEVRLKAELTSIKNLRGIAKVEIKTLLEINGNKKPALVATVLFLYKFKN